jgi:hypothetical protein
VDVPDDLATFTTGVAIFIGGSNQQYSLTSRQAGFEFKRGMMTIEYDEKGKIFTEVVSKVAIQATIQTTTHLMRGHVHVRRDQRIKDELDTNESFLALTDVSVLSPDGQILFQAPFLAVRRSQIVWVLPEETMPEEGAA